MASCPDFRPTAYRPELTSFPFGYIGIPKSIGLGRYFGVYYPSKLLRSMLLDVFKPAQPGLTPEQVEARNEREKSALSSLAGILTNAPMPDGFAVELMQGYVDGELSLAEVKERIIAETKRRYSSPST